MEDVKTIDNRCRRFQHNSVKPKVQEIAILTTKTEDGFYCNICDTHHLITWDRKCTHKVVKESGVCLSEQCAYLMGKEWK